MNTKDPKKKLYVVLARCLWLRIQRENIYGLSINRHIATTTQSFILRAQGPHGSNPKQNIGLSHAHNTDLSCSKYLIAFFKRTLCRDGSQHAIGAGFRLSSLFCLWFRMQRENNGFSINRHIASTTQCFIHRAQGPHGSNPKQNIEHDHAISRTSTKCPMCADMPLTLMLLMANFAITK